MLSRLANLAGGHPKRVLIFAGLFFILAGALGSGVADRLDPYGADDPDKEAFIAKQKLEGAGYRDAQAIILIQNTDPTTPEGAERVSEIGKETSGVEGVRGVSGFAETKSKAFVSKGGQSTYLAVQFEGTEDDTLQDTGEALVVGVRGRGQHPRRRQRGCPAADQRERRVRPAARRAPCLPDPLPPVAAFLPKPGRGRAPTPDRRPRDRLDLSSPDRRQRARLDLDLRAQPRDRPRPWARDRLQPVRRLPLPGGDREDGRRHGGVAANDGHGRPHRRVLLRHRRRRFGSPRHFPAALSLFDGDRWRARGPCGSGNLADRSAGGPSVARGAGQLAFAQVPPAPRRGRLAPCLRGLLVPPVAHHHAHPRPDRRSPARPF